jgi:hypothetical protein
MDTIKAYFYQGLCVILGLLLGIQSYRVATAQAAEWKAKNTLSTAQATVAANLALGESKNRKTEGDLVAKAADTRKDTNEKTTVVYRDSDALLKRLRIAESNLATERLMSKAGTIGSNGQASTGSNGGEVPTEIGEEDVQEAKRADLIRIGLTACYKQYDEAREALSKSQ